MKWLNLFKRKVPIKPPEVGYAKWYYGLFTFTIVDSDNHALEFTVKTVPSGLEVTSAELRLPGKDPEQIIKTPYVLLPGDSMQFNSPLIPEPNA
jgi:hypothetical protein